MHNVSIESWKRVIYISWFILFFQMAGAGMLMPFLPLYIKELGITNPKTVSVWSGLIFGITFLLVGLCSPFWGTFSDRYGRKPIILRATFGLSVVCALMSIVTNVYQLLALRILQGFLGGIVPAFIALVSFYVPKEKVGWGLGVLQTAMISGSITGPLIGGILSDLIGYRNVLLIISSFSLLAGITTIFFIKEPKLETKSHKFKVFDNIKFVFSSKQLLTIASIQFITQFSVMSVQPILPLFIESLHGKTNIGTMVGLVFGITGIFNIIFTPIWGKIGDKKGHKNILSRNLLLVGITFFPQALVTSLYQLLPLRAIIGSFVGGVVPSIQSLIVKNTTNQRRGGIWA